MNFIFILGQTNPQGPQYNLRSSPDTSSSFDFYPNIIINNKPNTDSKIPTESSNILPNKSDSGVEGAASSLDTPLPLITTPEEENNYSNNNIIYTNSNQTNSLSNTYTSSPSKPNQNHNKTSRGKYYNNNRGNLNRRGSFGKRWRGPGYSSDHQPSALTDNNNSSPGRGSEYPNGRYKQPIKVALNNIATIT